MPLAQLTIEGGRFVDAHGREVLLRGVNLGGDSKVPWPDGGTDRPSDFSDHRCVSFVGRPFPLAEASEHFSRLHRWGFNCLRLLVTWEAVEHAGPGLYDQDYLDYIAEVARLAGDHDFYVFVDFHQDAWSRMSGGCGAPGWTFEAVGLEFSRFHAADAALVMQSAFDYASGNPHQSAYPRRAWPSNYKLPANMIMWSLFFGGRWLTPKFQVDGLNVQEFLQRRYLACVDQVARRLAHLPHVIGFDSLNEPSIGWLGQGLSDRGLTNPSPLAMGPALSPLDALALAGGTPVNSPVLGGREEGTPRVVAEKILNPDRISIWRQDASCPFEAAGVYERRADHLVALDEDVFRRGPDGAGLDVPRDVFAPFFARVADTIRTHRQDWALFAEVEVAGPFIGRSYPADMPRGAVNTPHWYDLASLTTKRFDPDDHFDAFSHRPLNGVSDIKRSYAEGLAERKRLADPFGGPTLIGEIGVHFDLNDGESLKAWAAGGRGPEAFAKQVLMLELMAKALDESLLSATWWNYSASNRNDPRIGDRWNQEDMSLFSRDQQTGGCDGGRAVAGFARPFVRAAQGRLVLQRYDRATGVFEAVINTDPAVHAPSEIALPVTAFPDGVEVHGVGHCVVMLFEGGCSILARDAGRLAIKLTRRDPALA